MRCGTPLIAAATVLLVAACSGPSDGTPAADEAPTAATPEASQPEGAGAGPVALTDVPTCGDVLGDDEKFDELVRSLLKDASDEALVQQYSFEGANVCGSATDEPVANVLLQVGLTQDDLNVDWGASQQHEPEPVTEVGTDGCSTYVTALKQDPILAGTEPLEVSAVERLGADVPPATCALRTLDHGGTGADYFLWDDADFDALHDRLTDAGFTDGMTTWTDPQDPTARKYMFLAPDGSLGWLDSGAGVNPGIAPDTVLLVVFVESP